MKHVAFVLLTLAFTAACAMIMVGSLDIWPDGVDRALTVTTLLRWAIVLGSLGIFVGLGVAIVSASMKSQGDR